MDTTAGVGPVVVAADLRAALRHRWWVLVICGLLGLSAAAIAVKVMPTTYAATTTVNVLETGEERATAATTNGGSTSKLVNMDTEAMIVTSAAVAEKVRSDLKTSTSAADLVDEVTVEVPPNTTILDITATTASAADAQRLSRAFARDYLAQREDNAKAVIAGQVKIYQARITDTTARLKTVTGQIAALPANSPDRAYAEANQRILVDQVTNLSGQLSTLQAITVTPGRVLSEAPLPTDTEQPAPILLLAGGLLFGLLGGLGLAVLLAKLDRRIRRAADLHALGDVPLLGSIPPSRSSGAGVPGVAPSASPIGQAFGQIRNDVTTALPTRPATLLVAGTEAGPGGSLVAANLAVALARSGVPVLLICADFAGSSVERMLGLEGLSRADGLAEALAGQTEPVNLLRAAPVVPGLWVLGAGRGRDGAAELLQSRQLEWVLQTVRGESFVILEAPPTSSGADAQAMARLCDAAILVSEIGRSRLDAIDDGAHQLARVGTPLLGVVVTQRQPAAKRKRRQGPSAPMPDDRPSLAEATVAIRADQLKGLRSGNRKELTADPVAPASPSREDGERHATAGAPFQDRPAGIDALGDRPIGGLSRGASDGRSAGFGAPTGPADYGYWREEPGYQDEDDQVTTVAEFADGYADTEHYAADDLAHDDLDDDVDDDELPAGADVLTAQIDSDLDDQPDDTAERPRGAATLRRLDDPAEAWR